MSGPLKGKIAVITGSSRSIGAAIAKHMGEQGAKVVVNYLNDAMAAEEVVSVIQATNSGSAVAVKADASTITGGQHLIYEAVKAFGGIDILVLNAGITTFSSSHWATNVTAPLFLAKAVAPLLPTPGGRIILFSSRLTDSSVVAPNSLLCTASTAAVEQISRILARDLGTKGITVNTVFPGPVDRKPQQLIDILTKLMPSGRLSEFDDVVRVVCFLSTPTSQWFNGQNLRIHGG
ncbi:hypothetical protein DFH09DRAFT_339303 [Mycena vulgaris]|nr:hypothetical protein DFH09DRAFT_339303 [Mycena vulgaris]